MAKCKHETKNGRCGLKESYAYRKECYTEECCRCHEPIEPCGRNEPMTNADRIRATTNDKELANCIVEIGFDCHLCSEHERLSDNPLLRHEKCDEKCAEHCLEWLQAPAEGE